MIGCVGQKKSVLIAPSRKVPFLSPFPEINVNAISKKFYIFPFKKCLTILRQKDTGRDEEKFFLFFPIQQKQNPSTTPVSPYTLPSAQPPAINSDKKIVAVESRRAIPGIRDKRPTSDSFWGGQGGREKERKESALPHKNETFSHKCFMKFNIISVYFREIPYKCGK